MVHSGSHRDADLFALMKASSSLAATSARNGSGLVASRYARIDAVVLVSLPGRQLQALAYAKATRPDTLTALTVATGRLRFSS